MKILLVCMFMLVLDVPCLISDDLQLLKNLQDDTKWFKKEKITVNYLPPNVFCGAPHIKGITFIEGEVLNISADAFQCLSQLEHVYVCNCGTRTLPPGLFNANHHLCFAIFPGEYS